MLNLSFSALRDGDGETHGQFQSFDTTTGGKLHAEIDCIAVSGNLATLSGLVKSSNVGLGPGDRIAFTVQDNGEGKDVIDIMSNVRGGSGLDCSVEWPLEFVVSKREHPGPCGPTVAEGLRSKSLWSSRIRQDCDGEA